MIVIFLLPYLSYGTEVTQPDQFFILHQKYNLLQQEHANLLNQLSLSLRSIANQSLEIQVLKDEIARLKGTSPRPKLPPNRLEGQGGGSGGNGGGKPGRGKHPRKNKTGLNFQRVMRLKPDNLPEGAKYKDAHKYVFKTSSIKPSIRGISLSAGNYQMEHL